MDRQEILKALKEIRASSPAKKFSQSIDMQIRLQGIDIKKPDQKVDFYIVLPHSIGKKRNIIGFVDAQLAPQAKQLLDNVILKEDFAKYAKDKKTQRKLTNNIDFTIAQLEVMGIMASTFGKVFGPRGKMPDPKAGCVIPGSAQLAPLVQKLQNTIRLVTKTDPVIRTFVGTDKMNDEELADNILAAYNTLLTKLAQEKNNIKDVILKLTMGPAYIVGTGFKNAIVTKEKEKAPEKKVSKGAKKQSPEIENK